MVKHNFLTLLVFTLLLSFLFSHDEQKWINNKHWLANVASFVLIFEHVYWIHWETSRGK